MAEDKEALERYLRGYEATLGVPLAVPPSHAKALRDLGVDAPYIELPPLRAS